MAPSCVTLKICLASLSPGLVYTQSTVGSAQATLGAQRAASGSSHTPAPLEPVWAQSLLQPALTVQDPTPQMLACCLAVSTQADKVPKTPHPGLGHEPEPGVSTCPTASSTHPGKTPAGLPFQ